MVSKIIFAAATIFLVNANADAQKRVTWETEAKHVKGNNYELVFKANIVAGNYLYSQFVPENGPIPTSFDYSLNKSVVLVGKTNEKGSHRYDAYDPLFEMNIVKYSEEVFFTQRLTTADVSQPLKVLVNYMVCDDRSCEPFSDEEYVVTLPTKKAKKGCRKK